jgi:hypothetical protein
MGGKIPALSNENKPDKLEMGIRFGCGGLLGAAIGFSFIIELFPNRYAIFVFCIAGAMLCGLLAMRYGDRFWHIIKDWLFSP